MSELGPLSIFRRTGAERFRCEDEDLGFDLLSFWQWSTSDLVSNATRGVLAEYIVARALGLQAEGVRNEWAAYDLQTEDGVKVEVKSAAFVQSWHQESLSLIQFRVRKTQAWDPETNLRTQERRRQADVYVFALLAHQDKHSIDPLNVGQWQFYVLPTSDLDARQRSQYSVTLKSLQHLCGSPVGYGKLAEAVNRAAAVNEQAEHVEQSSMFVTEDYLHERAKRGSRSGYESALAEVPDVEPDPMDKIQSTETSYQKSWDEARSRKTKPVSELWEEDNDA
jgi:hypothetical protein